MHVPHFEHLDHLGRSFGNVAPDTNTLHAAFAIRTAIITIIVRQVVTCKSVDSQSGAASAPAKCHSCP